MEKVNKEVDALKEDIENKKARKKNLK